MEEWFRTNTQPTDIFLAPFHDKATVEYPDVALLRTAFQRKLWVDFKSGAAVMWQPSYYPEWSTRKNEVLALGSVDSKLEYARLNKIDYLLDLCALEHAPETVEVFRTSRLCLYQVAKR